MSTYIFFYLVWLNSVSWIFSRKIASEIRTFQRKTNQNVLRKPKKSELINFLVLRTKLAAIYFINFETRFQSDNICTCKVCVRITTWHDVLWIIVKIDLTFGYVRFFSLFRNSVIYSCFIAIKHVAISRFLAGRIFPRTSLRFFFFFFYRHKFYGTIDNK